MCGAGHEHACERRTTIPFEAVASPGRPLTRTNRVRLLRDGADTFTAMLELIEHAETEILLENYIIRADVVGRAFGEALKTRARAGVDVRILHDPFGDPLSLLSLHLQFWGSRARMSVYNPPRPTLGYLRAWRDHRKLIVQDLGAFVQRVRRTRRSIITDDNRPTTGPTQVESMTVEMSRPGQTTSAEYICPMHPEVRRSPPGNCHTCGMTLERTMPSAPAARTEWTCPMHPEIVREAPLQRLEFVHWVVVHRRPDDDDAPVRRPGASVQRGHEGVRNGTRLRDFQQRGGKMRARPSAARLE